MTQPTHLRGGESFVAQMGWLWQRPSLVALEILWRWLAGLPLLWLLRHAIAAILVATPISSSGLDRIDWQNPWNAVVEFAAGWGAYSPALAHLATWLVPLGFVLWSVASGIGRNLVLRRMTRAAAWRPAAMIALQAAWLAALFVCVTLWWMCVSVAAHAHLFAGGEPDLVGFFSWLVALTLSFYALWACSSWIFAFAPVLLLMERHGVLASLLQSACSGRVLAQKLIELNFVRGITRIGLLVLAMVISAAPLPFSDLMTADGFAAVGIFAALFFVVLSDWFHALRLLGMMGLWERFRG